VTTASPSRCPTLGDMFDTAAQLHPARRVGTFFAESSITFEQLGRSGRNIAGNLVEAGVRPGDPVAVLVQSNLGLLQAIHGTARAGAAVLPLPMAVGAPNRTQLARLMHVLAHSGARYLVVDDTASALVAELPRQVMTLALSALAERPTGTALPHVDAHDLALIQYTSGSTSAPRGVALTHANILAGVRAIQQVAGMGPDDLLCHWLPLSHDMGMFSTLAAVAAGMEVRISPPADFIKHPDRWLRKLCDLRATMYAAPNFSYQLLIDTIPLEETAEYDLSSARVLLNGAEPVDPHLVTGFGRHFAASRLSPAAMTPGYGLAEATLGVSFSPADAPGVVDWVDRDLLNSAGEARQVAPGTDNARGVVSCGPPVPGIEVRITADGRPLGERLVGDIEIRGDAVMGGFYREEEPSLLPGGWYATGDLGYLSNGRLHVTGRKKEMLIIGGRNYYPQDVEDAVRRVRGVHNRHAVAVVLPADDDTGTPERIAVLAEVNVPPAQYGVTLAAVRDASAAELDGASVDVVLMRRNSLPRTTSGKFQRVLVRDRLQRGTLDHVLVHLPSAAPVSTVASSDPCVA
jgi:fatty-acyl-CoA synthase